MAETTTLGTKWEYDEGSAGCLKFSAGTEFDSS
jgi:hypothetical protein